MCMPKLHVKENSVKAPEASFYQLELRNYLNFRYAIISEITQPTKNLKAQF